MKKSNKMLIALLSIALGATASFAACDLTPDNSGSGNSNIEQPCSIELNKSILTLEEGKSEILTVLGNNGATVEWSSSDTAVATVVDGVVTALKKGTATITVTCGDATATCVLTVVEPVVLTLNESELMLFEGETATLTVTASNGANYTYEWTSSDPNVASVENGVVTALGEGTAVIKAQFGDKTVECEVTVQKEIVVMVLDNSNMALKVGATGTLTATLSDGSTPTIAWESSDNTIASVENGVVTGIKAGTCTITATAGELSATCTVVIEDTFELLFPEMPEMVYVGEELDLGIVLKKNGEAQGIENATITGEGFTVVDGKVTMTKSGSISITATYNGISTTKTIAAYVKVSSVEDFKAIADDLSGWYKLTCNLDFNGETFNAFSSYKTKTSSGKSFTGVFDGNGYAINNMVVGYNTENSSDRDRAIFGYMEGGAVVKNVAFVNMKGADRAAVVASWCADSTIENVYVDFTYTSKGGNNSTGNPSGIICAKLQKGGVIKNSIVKLTIASGAFDEGYMGCIVGANNNGQIENCQAIYTPNNAETENLGIVYSTPGAGSVVTSSKVYNDLAAFYNKDTGADVSAYGLMWKFVEGYDPYFVNMSDILKIEAAEEMYQGTTLTIETESDYASVLTLKENVEGVTLEGNVLSVANTVAGDTTVTVVLTSTRFPELKVEHTITVKANAYSVTSTEENISIETAIIGETTKEFGVTVSLNGNVITEGYEIAVDNTAVVTLADGVLTVVGEGTANINVTVNGETIYIIPVTITNAYTAVRTIDEFKAINTDATTRAGKYMLMNDIDFNGAEFAGFSSNKDQTKPFAGVFDGNGYSFRNIKPAKCAVSGSNADRSIFGVLGIGAVVRNLSIVGAEMDGWGGVLASYVLKNAVIENCYVDVTVTGTDSVKSQNDIGAFVWRLQASATIRNCISVVTVANGVDTTYVAGTIGMNLGKIENCQTIVTSGNALKVFTSEHASVKGTVSNSAVYAGVDAFYNTESGADLTKYGDIWVLEQGKLPHLNKLVEEEALKIECNDTVYQGTSIEIVGKSKYGAMLTLKETIDGVSLVNNVLAVDSTVAKDTVIVVVLTSKYYSDVSIEKEITVAEISYEVTSTESSVTMDTVIIGETTKDLGITVKTNGQVVTEGYEIVSDNTAVVTLTNDVLTVVGEGTANVNVTVNGATIYSIPVTVTNAYIAVRTVSDFTAINTDATTRAGKYMLMNNIDFKGAEFAGFGSNKVQTAGNTFTGVFDGNGYSLQNIKPVQCATSGSNADRSIFGVLGDSTGAGATIRNLSIVGAEIDGWGGVLASYVLKNVLIENCYVEVTVTGTDSVKSQNDIGAFVWRLQASATIRNCISVVTVANGVDTTYVAGTIGMNLGKIENCQAIVTSGNTMKVFTSEHASVKGTVSNSAVYAGVDAFYNAESGADLTKYDTTKYWTFDSTNKTVALKNGCTVLIEK